ncbi:MAG: hydrolase [Planctomycetes bacterium]|nr:hydrolase [Planctomycetota bacterium]
MLTPQNTCLVVVDIQEKLHKLMVNCEQVESNCLVLVKLAQALDIPILWCQQVPKVLGPTIQPLWSLLNEQASFDKCSFSCYGDEAIAAEMDKIKPETAILCGIEAHVCVFQTAMDLIDKGIDVHVIADATSSRTNENKQIALHRMGKEGVTLSSTEMCLFELLRTSKHEKFRELAKLIK